MLLTASERHIVTKERRVCAADRRWVKNDRRTHFLFPFLFQAPVVLFVPLVSRHELEAVRKKEKRKMASNSSQRHKERYSV